MICPGPIPSSFITSLPMISFGAVEICHLYISRDHNFFGHYGREPDDFLMIEVPSVECVAGHGIRGDRFFDYRSDYKGQVTFFALEVFDELCGALELQDCSPSLVRRNVMTRELDLLRKLEPGKIFVSARTDPAWRAMDVEFVPDAQRSRGPLSGIAATLARATTDHLLVLGIDMPFMSADYLRELSERSRPGCGV